VGEPGAVEVVDKTPRSPFRRLIDSAISNCTHGRDAVKVPIKITVRR
jgi:hypothetical protein